MKPVGISVPRTESQEDVSASVREVYDAIENLTEMDRVRLMKAARFCARRSGYLSEDDIISEATTRALSGTRLWPKNRLTFVRFMLGVIRSISSAARTSVAATRTDSLDALAANVQAPIDEVLGGMNCARPSIEQETIQTEEILERQRQAAMDVDLINECFADDPQVRWLIGCYGAGQSPSKSRGSEQMTDTQFATVRRRFRRKLERLFQGRGKR